jgi:hypothetical protein
MVPELGRGEGVVFLSNLVAGSCICRQAPVISGAFGHGRVCVANGAVWYAGQNAAVAHQVEHIIRNDGVVGSSPISGTSLRN